MFRLWKTASASRPSSVCGTFFFFFFLPPNLNLWPLSLLMILMNFEASPTSFLRTPWFTGVTGAEMHTAIFTPWCRCSDSWTAEGVTAGPEGEGGATADWVSRADSQRHGWKKTSCSSVSSHPLIDLGFADVLEDNLKWMLCSCSIWCHLDFPSISSAFTFPGSFLSLGCGQDFSKNMLRKWWPQTRIWSEPLCLFRC